MYKSAVCEITKCLLLRGRVYHHLLLHPNILGPGFQSPQQRARALLEHLDPELVETCSSQLLAAEPSDEPSAKRIKTEHVPNKPGPFLRLSLLLMPEFHTPHYFRLAGTCNIVWSSLECDMLIITG